MNNELLTKNYTEKDTKAVLINALKEIQKEFTELSAGKLDLKGDAVKKEEKVVLETGKSAVSENVKIKDELSKFGTLVNKTLADIEEKITVKVEDFNAIVSAIELKTKELSEIIEIEGKVLSLAELIDAEKALRKAFEEEKAKVKAEIEEAKATAKADADAEKARIEAERAREKEEYEYKRNRDRKIDQDEYEDKKAEREKAIAVKEEDLNVREVAIKGREDYLAELEETIAGIPAKIDAAKEEGIKEGKAKAETANSFEVKAIKAEAKAAKDLADAEIRMLKDTISRLEKENTEYKEANKDAVSQVKSIATSALEAAGNARMVSTLEGIAGAKDSKNK